MRRKTRRIRARAVRSEARLACELAREMVDGRFGNGVVVPYIAERGATGRSADGAGEDWTGSEGDGKVGCDGVGASDAAGVGGGVSGGGGGCRGRCRRERRPIF